MTLSDPMIVVEGLRRSIRNGTRTVEILKGLDFVIPRGQFAAIMGSSGSGKSTLLGLLAGLDTPTAGNVFLNGTAISYLPEDKLAQVRGRTIGFVFQSYQLIPTLTALENVLLPYELNSEAKDGRAGLGRARELLASVGDGRSLPMSVRSKKAAAAPLSTATLSATSAAVRNFVPSDRAPGS